MTRLAVLEIVNNTEIADDSAYANLANDFTTCCDHKICNHLVLHKQQHLHPRVIKDILGSTRCN